MEYKLHAVYEPCQEGGFHAYIEEIPGIHSEGETIEEARDNLADAFREILIWRTSQGLSGVPGSDITEPLKVSLAGEQKNVKRSKLEALLREHGFHKSARRR